MALSNGERQKRYRENSQAELATLRSFNPSKRDVNDSYWLKRSDKLRGALTLPRLDDAPLIAAAFLELIEDEELDMRVLVEMQQIIAKRHEPIMRRMT